MKYRGNRHCFSLSIQRECDREGPPQRGRFPPQEHPGEPRLQTQGLRRPDREEELRFWRAILQLWGHSAGKAKAAKEAAGEQRGNTSAARVLSLFSSVWLNGQVCERSKPW